MLHTAEELTVTYWAKGRYEPAHGPGADGPALWAPQLPRDGAGMPGDLGLPLPGNERRAGGAQRGVAWHSLHMDGRAIDIRIHRVALHDLRRAALDLRGGGVGYYPDLDFVHVDTGRVRLWQRSAGSRLLGRYGSSRSVGIVPTVQAFPRCSPFASSEP